MILVDDVREYTVRGLRFKWSHLVSTTGEAELHAFAAQLGMKRRWAQFRPKASAAHYDVLPARRVIALQLGAKEVSTRNLARLNYDGRTRRGLHGDEAQAVADAEANALCREARRTDVGV